jgi:hypothetical protein
VFVVILLQQAKLLLFVHCYLHHILGAFGALWVLQ